MPIHYVLRDNKLTTTDLTDFAAIVTPVGSAGPEELAQRIVDRGSTTGKADILAVLEDLSASVESLLLDGFRVNLPIVSFSTSLGGPDGLASGLRSSKRPVSHLVNASCRCATRTPSRPGHPRVADEALDPLVEHFSRSGALDPHAADQFILPLALAPGASEFTTTCVTDHLVTHIAVLRQFLDRRIELSAVTGAPVRVTIA